MKRLMCSKRQVGTGLVALALMGWMGCADGNKDTAPSPLPVATPAATVHSAVDPRDGNKAGATAEVAAFSYSPVGRRDPFRSYLTQVKERQDAQAQDHRHEETENFEVNQFRLTGLVTGTSQPKAMVDDPNGEAHVLHIGSRVGKNGGRVYAIGARGVTVLEEYVDATGKAVSVPIKVNLPDDMYQDVATQE